MNDTPTPSRGFTSEFWFGQMVVVICTIVGIYLAATLGFSKAVDLTLLQSDRNTYYLANSFQGEIDSNLSEIGTFLTEHGDAPFMPDNASIKLNHFVFDTMQFAESTMELPPAVINGVSTFYLEAGEIMTQLNAKQLNKQSGFTRLQTLIDELKADELPKLNQTVSTLKQKLADAGITP
ncbi:MAG: hypothetical protein V3V20_09975 [Algisphaera sp.]